MCRLFPLPALVIALAYSFNPIAAIAQDGLAGYSPFADRVMVGPDRYLWNLPLKYLAYELSLSDDQKTKVVMVQEETRKAILDLIAKAPSISRLDPLTRSKIARLERDANLTVRSGLVANQLTRLPLREVRAFLSLDIPLTAVPELKLTQEQLTKFRNLVSDLDEETTRLTKGHTGQVPEANTMLERELRELRSKAKETASSMLTETQRTAVSLANQNKRKLLVVIHDRNNKPASPEQLKSYFLCHIALGYYIDLDERPLKDAVKKSLIVSPTTKPSIELEVNDDGNYMVWVSSSNKPETCKLDIVSTEERALSDGSSTVQPRLIK